MIDPKMLDDLAKKLADSVPTGVRELQQDLEKNFHAALQSAFNKMELVTREEFEVQSTLLARTRAKVDALQNQIDHLEQQLKEDQSSNL
jgi:BMFP domain-containing protein YqiC